MPDPKKPKTEAEWSAWGDARTLVSAEEVRSDPERMRKAKTWLDDIKAEAEQEVNAVERLSRGLKSSAG